MQQQKQGRNAGVSPLRRAKGRAAPVEMTAFSELDFLSLGAGGVVSEGG
jgi:hypothetical protein